MKKFWFLKSYQLQSSKKGDGIQSKKKNIKFQNFFVML